MYKFWKPVITVFGEVYLKQPNVVALPTCCVHQRGKGVSEDDRKYRLHALEVEELSIRMVETV
jgi:hypothetical protein